MAIIRIYLWIHYSDKLVFKLLNIASFAPQIKLSTVWLYKYVWFF